MTHNSLLITLLFAGATRGFATGGASRCSGERFFSAGCTKNGKFLLYFLRAALRALYFLISKDKLLEVFSAAHAFIFIYRHLPPSKSAP